MERLPFRTSSEFEAFVVDHMKKAEFKPAQPTVARPNGFWLSLPLLTHRSPPAGSLGSSVALGRTTHTEAHVKSIPLSSPRGRGPGTRSPGGGIPLVFLHGWAAASSCDYPRVARDSSLFVPARRPHRFCLGLALRSPVRFRLLHSSARAASVAAVISALSLRYARPLRPQVWRRRRYRSGNASSPLACAT